MKLVLAAVIAAIQAQPRQHSHPRAAVRALEMVDAAWAGGKQVVHSEADPDVMGPPCQALRLIADVYCSAAFFQPSMTTPLPCSRYL